LHIAELRKRATETDAKLKRLYDAIENGVADLSDPVNLRPRATRPALTQSGPRMRLNGPGRRFRHRLSRRLLEQPARVCGPTAAATAAMTFARSPKGSKSICNNCASWVRKARFCVRSLLFKAQKRRVLRAQFYTEVAKRFELMTPRFVVKRLDSVTEQTDRERPASGDTTCDAALAIDLPSQLGHRAIADFMLRLSPCRFHDASTSEI
jgi:hypothetical protein